MVKNNVKISKGQNGNEFQKYSKGARNTLITEFWFFLKHNKKWWLLPILIVLFILGVLIFLGDTGLAPFIYPLF